VGFA
jgi:hypothetical protein